MPVLGAESKKQLSTCDTRLQLIANEAIKYVDFKVLEGHRNKAAQELAFAKGLTKLHYPYGNHNSLPSRAFDFAPFPVDWSERSAAIARFAFVAGVFLVVSRQLGIKIRFGWDWNRNLDPRDESFIDWPHIELDEP